MTMSLYSLHFVIATILATVLSVILSYSWRMRFIAAIAIPISFYTLFYNFNYGIVGGFFPIAVSYAGSAYICLLFLVLVSAKYVTIQTLVVQKIFRKIVLLFFAQFFCVLLASIIPWAFDTFPLSNIEAVLFTLFAGTNEGSEEFVISSISDKVVVPCIKIFVVLVIVQMSFAFALHRMDRGIEFCFKKIRYSLNSGEFKISLFQLQKGLTSVFVFYCFVLSLTIPGIVLSAPFRALLQIPVDSELYRNHFEHLDSLKYGSPGKPRNLIVILMESMETNFEHYTPEIVERKNNNTNFSPGGMNVAGTSWTIAAITAKLCGIPLNMPMGINEYLGKLPTYLPGAKCLMDYLRDFGYNQIFVQGSSGSFTQINDFCEVHGSLELHDLEYYKQNGLISKDYRVFWGIEDRKLYHFIKGDLERLSHANKPFALYMSTMDTHLPEGYVDSKCAEEFADVVGKYPKALRCASKQLDDFLKWAELQPWYANTTISIMGDHTMPSLSVKAGVPRSDSLYWTNFIINSAVTIPVRERQYSSLDMFPTLLEAMGFKLENRSAGLGRSLYSDSLTMLELYGRQVLDSLLRERSIQYDDLLFGKKN